MKIRVFDPEDVCIEEYASWEEAARTFLKMLNEVERENYTIDERPSLEDLVNPPIDFVTWAMNTHPIVYNRLRKAYDEVRKE